MTSDFIKPYQPMIARAAIMLITSLLASMTVPLAHAAEPTWKLEFISDLNIPTGTPYESVHLVSSSSTTIPVQAQDESPAGVRARKASGAFGSISAIAFDPKTSTLYALSDSSTPTMFPFLLSVSDGHLQLRPTTLVRFSDRDGTPLPQSTVDPEGLALSSNGTLYLSSEGYVALNPPVPPAILEFSLDGRLIGEFDIPPTFLPADDGGSPRGVRANKGFESLTLSPDATRLYTAAEHPLRQDPPGCRLNEPCVVRVLEFVMNEGPRRAIHEYFLQLDPLTSPPGFMATTGTLGLSDLLSLGNGALLAVERGFVEDETGNGRNRIRIHHLTTEGATDVLLESPSSSAPVVHARKTLVADLDDILEQLHPDFRSLDNFEGICFGPTLSDGSRSVILVSDNNFSSTQRTVFLLFRLKKG